MGNHQLIITALVFALAVIARVELTTCHVLKGSVTCLDCSSHHDLSDIKVLVKCNQVKKLAMATTSQDGTFQTELPTPSTPTSSPLNCQTKILGGPTQLYISKKNMVSKIAKVPQYSNSYTISSPLMFYTSCPLSENDVGKCGARNTAFDSSKTVDLPFPPAWGLAPSSYYIPFIPIIGIP